MHRPHSSAHCTEMDARLPDGNGPCFPVAIPQNLCHTYVALTQEGWMAASKLDLLQGTLDLMVLQTLAAMGSLHGYGIARRIEQVSGEESY